MTASVPTTTFGTWVNIQPNGSGTTPESYVAEALSGYTDDYDVEALVNAFMAELQKRLPAGLTILGNGELVGPAYGPEHDAFPEDVCAAVAEIIGGDEDGVGGIDLAELMEEHDYTLGPFVIYARGTDGEERDVDPQLYPYNDRRTLAQALADARDKYAAATGLARDAILLEQLDETDPAVQDAIADSGPTVRRQAGRPRPGHDPPGRRGKPPAPPGDQPQRRRVPHRPADLRRRHRPRADRDDRLRRRGRPLRGHVHRDGPARLDHPVSPRPIPAPPAGFLPFVNGYDLQAGGYMGSRKDGQLRAAAPAGGVSPTDASLSPVITLLLVLVVVLTVLAPDEEAAIRAAEAHLRR